MRDHREPRAPSRAGRLFGRFAIHALILLTLVLVAAVVVTLRSYRANPDEQTTPSQVSEPPATTAEATASQPATSGRTASPPSTPSSEASGAIPDSEVDGYAVLNEEAAAATLEVAEPEPPAEATVADVEEESAATLSSAGQAAALGPVYFDYIVRDGDTLSGIAGVNGLRLSTLIWNNPQVGDGSLVTNGDTLRVPIADGILYTVQEGDTLSGIVAAYLNVTVTDVMAFAPNGIAEDVSLPTGRTILLPNAEPVVVSEPVATEEPAPVVTEEPPPPPPPTPTPTPTPEPPPPPPPPTPTPTPEPPPPAPTQAPPPPTHGPGAGNSCEAEVRKYDWDIKEALELMMKESSGNPWALNPYSGACGCFQTLPCIGWGDPVVNVKEAYRLWLDGGRSFWKHWYRWW